jgi:hypothetical protein
MAEQGEGTFVQTFLVQLDRAPQGSGGRAGGNDPINER